MPDSDVFDCYRTYKMAVATWRVDQLLCWVLASIGVNDTKMLMTTTRCRVYSLFNSNAEGIHLVHSWGLHDEQDVGRWEG